MSERGAVGKATFDRVQELVAGGMTRSAAFAHVAEESGRSAATVATSFYRVARQQPDGGGVQQRARRRRASSASTAATRRTPRSSASTEALIADVHRAIDALGAHLQSLESEVRSLRENGDRIAQIRRVLS
jgi:hypothetical protein